LARSRVFVHTEPCVAYKLLILCPPSRRVGRVSFSPNGPNPFKLLVLSFHGMVRLFWSGRDRCLSHGGFPPSSRARRLFPTVVTSGYFFRVIFCLFSLPALFCTPPAWGDPVRVSLCVSFQGFGLGQFVLLTDTFDGLFLGHRS